MKKKTVFKIYIHTWTCIQNDDKRVLSYLYIEYFQLQKDFLEVLNVTSYKVRVRHADDTGQKKYEVSKKDGSKGQNLICVYVDVYICRGFN